MALTSRWRIGPRAGDAARQSANRTVYVISSLRHEHDLDVRYHLYPHVELRVDGWSVPESGIAEHAFRILIPNEYEVNKVDPRLIFGGSGIELHDLVVSPRQQRGRVWLPKAREITGMAGVLRESRSSPKLALVGVAGWLRIEYIRKTTNGKPPPDFGDRMAAVSHYDRRYTGG